MKNLKMTIFSDNKLSIRSYSTINKLLSSGSASIRLNLKNGIIKCVSEFKRINLTTFEAIFDEIFL